VEELDPSAITATSPSGHHGRRFSVGPRSAQWPGASGASATSAATAPANAAPGMEETRRMLIAGQVHYIQT
jgi:hypothetical protein